LKSVYVLLFILLTLLGCEKAPQPQEKQLLHIMRGDPVDAKRGVKFPEDHGAHLAQGIEWWYITATLTAETGETFGAQWTLFRTQVHLPFKSTWWDDQLYFAHFALQHEQKHVAFERYARAGQAQITAQPFNASLDDWSLKSQARDFLPLQMKAKQGDYAIDVSLTNSPLTLHGDNGYSQKTQSGHASYYFSYPFLETAGTLTFAGKDYKVTGNAWYDREWSTSLIDKNQMGWDWFSLVSGTDKSQKTGLMLFCIRDSQQNYDYCSGTHINEHGQTQQIHKQDILLEKLEHISIDNKRYPSKWRVTLPNIEPIVIETLTKDSVNKLSIQYWEGRVKASGGFKGVGYAELFGY